MKKAFPMYGGKKPMTTDEKLRELQMLVERNGRMLNEARAVGRKYLDDEKTLSPAGQRFQRTLEGFMDIRGHDKTSLAGRLTAMQELAPLKLSEDCSASDMDSVVHCGVKEQSAAPSSRPSQRQVPSFSDGTPVSPADREEVSRLGGPSRYERLRAIANAKGLNLGVRASREIAEAQLFAECASTVQCAHSLDEAVFVLQREDKGLSLRDATIKAVEMNPALRGSVGGRQSEGSNGNVVAFSQEEDPRAEIDRLVTLTCDRMGLDYADPRDHAQAQQVAFGRRPDLARALFFADRSHTAVRVDDSQAVQFTAKVEEMLAEQSLPRTPQNIAKASNAVKKRYPQLVSVPGSAGRK